MMERGKMLKGGWGKSGKKEVEGRLECRMRQKTKTYRVGQPVTVQFWVLVVIIFLVRISVDFLRNLISSSVSTWHGRV